MDTNVVGISPVEQFAYHDDTAPIGSWEECETILKGMVETHKPYFSLEPTCTEQGLSKQGYPIEGEENMGEGV